MWLILNAFALFATSSSHRKPVKWRARVTQPRLLVGADRAGEAHSQAGCPARAGHGAVEHRVERAGDLAVHSGVEVVAEVLPEPRSTSAGGDAVTAGAGEDQAVGEVTIDGQLAIALGPGRPGGDSVLGDELEVDRGLEVARIATA